MIRAHSLAPISLMEQTGSVIRHDPQVTDKI